MNWKIIQDKHCTWKQSYWQKYVHFFFQKAKSVTTRLACTHPFSKGTHKQKDVMSSEVKTNVSRSVGLIHIDGDPEGTGFRVGEKYIVTCVHVIKSVINGQCFKSRHIVENPQWHMLTDQWPTHWSFFYSHQYLLRSLSAYALYWSVCSFVWPRFLVRSILSLASYFTCRMPLGNGCAVTLKHVSKSNAKVIAE